MFRPLAISILLLLATPLLADPSGDDCPGEKGSPPQTDVNPSPSLPSTSPQEGATTQEPSTTKDQIGLTLDPSTMIPDKPVVEEKNPERKKLLDKIFDAKTKEAEAQVRLDELERQQKELNEMSRKISEEDKKLFKEWDEVLEKKANLSIFRSPDALDKETDRIMRALQANFESQEGLQKQRREIHQERMKMIDKEGDAISERLSFQESLGRMDAVQKNASRRDAGNAEVPLPRASRR